MFCEKCGNRIEITDKYCNRCGADLQATTSCNKTAINKTVSDGKRLLKSFLSKNPASVIDESKKVDSWIGVVFLFFTILLYSFVTCLNITQNINSVLNSINSVFNSVATNILGDNATEYLPNLEISLIIELFIPFFIFAVFVSLIAFGGLNISLKIRKMPIPNFKCSLNMLGSTSLPIATALIINLLLGFVFPQTTPLVFAISVFVSVIFVYEMIQSYFNNGQKPVFEIAIIIFIVLLLGIIILKVTINQIADVLQDLFINEAEKVIKNGADFISNLFGYIF